MNKETLRSTIEQIVINPKKRNKLKINPAQLIYEIGKSVGRIELLTSFVKEGREVQRAERELSDYREEFEMWEILNKSEIPLSQKPGSEERYLIEFCEKYNQLFEEYNEKLNELEDLLK